MPTFEMDVIHIAIYATEVALFWKIMQMIAAWFAAKFVNNSPAEKIALAVGGFYHG